MPSISRHMHRNLPFLPEKPLSAYGCQQTWEQTCLIPLTFLLPKKVYYSLSAHSKLCSLPSQVHFAWHFHLWETGITLCAQACCHPNTWARLYAVRRPMWEQPTCFPKAEVWGMCLAAPEVLYLHGTEQVASVSFQSWIDLGFAAVSQYNSEAGLVFGKSSSYVFGRCIPCYVAVFFPFWLSKESPLQWASSQMVQQN